MEKEKLITWNQIKAARGLLGWKQIDLASRADLSAPTIKAAENPAARVSDLTLFKIRRAMESMGIEFIENPTGVQLKEETA